jgi:NTP pyrophosphatase (non-canonical NTP hydrolase)
MDFKDLTDKAVAMKQAYDELNEIEGNKKWTSAEYTQGFVGDVGDLIKLVMAKNNYRNIDGMDKKIAHELADCLWSLMVISKELDVNLEQEFVSTIEELTKRINEKLAAK